MSDLQPDRSALLTGFVAQLETGTYLGTCDWGSCDNLQVGWARAEDEEEWLSICDPCRKRGYSKHAPGSYPVAEFISFRQAWRKVTGKPMPEPEPMDEEAA